MTSQPRVVVFTTPSCSWCRTVKQYLRKHQIRFREVDVTRDDRALKDMVRRSGQQGVPVVMVNNRPVVGFNKQELNRLLNIRDTAH